MRTVKKNPKPAPRLRPGAPTISDVARAAGVSTMTVSRVINRMGNVKSETLATVDAAIARLHYAPNPAARSLAGARQIRIGLLYSNPSATWLGELLVGALEQASRNHAQLVVEQCATAADGLQAAARLAAEGVDGLILPPPFCDHRPLLDILDATGTPHVVVASGSPPRHVSSVGIDELAAARTMTTHLIDQGHTRIGFIAGDPDLSASALRLQGYEAALLARGMKMAPELVEQGNYTYRSGLDAAERLLRLPTPPSAIFASNDDMAAATVAVAHSLGLGVPSDLTVCGFDDTLMATTIWPELTTVRQPIGTMARMALDTLASEVKARRAGQRPGVRHDRAEFALVRRHSDAAPRRRPPAARLRQA